jgi:hypothetical protein
LLDIIPSEKHDDGGEKNWYQKRTDGQKFFIWYIIIVTIGSIFAAMYDDYTVRGKVWW